MKQEFAIEEIKAMAALMPGDFVVYRLVGRTMKVLYFTETILSAFEVSDEDFRAAVRDDALDVVSPGDREYVLGTVLGKPVGPEMIECIFRLLHKEKGFFWVHSRSRIVGTVDGDPVILTNYTNLSAESAIFGHSVEDVETAFYNVDINDHEILYANRAAKEMAQVEDREFFNRYKCYEYFFGNSEPCKTCPIAEVLKTDRMAEIEEYDEDRQCWNRIRCKIVRWCGHQCLEVFVNDITTVKQEKERFNEAIQSLLDTNPDALCTFQLNLTRDLCYGGHGTSRYYLERLNSDTASGLFRNNAAMVPYPEDRRRLCDMFTCDRLIECYNSDKTQLQLDYRRQGENGRPFWVRTFVYLLKNPVTSDIEGVIYSTDISALKRDEEIFNIITSQECDYVAILDMEANTLEFMNLSYRLNEKYRSLLSEPGRKYDFDYIRHYTADSWVAAEDREYYLNNSPVSVVRQELERQGNYEMSIRGHYADRPDEYMCRKIQHYYLGDHRDTVLIIQTDVTETYLQQQREIDNARAASDAKSEFMSRMSHDIRTPLNGIIGMTYLAKKLDNSPEMDSYLNKIDTSSRFLLGLVNDVLDMSKAESGMIELHPEPYTSDQFMEYLQAVIIPLCREKNQEFIIEADPVPGIAPIMDPLRVNQIFFNLLSNSVKYTPEGGVIKYHLQENLTAGGKVALSAYVEDNGIGMSEAFQKVLFEPFTQENRDDVSKNRGTGLGLTIVRKMLDLMGGTIAVESRVGEGTKISLRAEFDYVDQEVIPAAAENISEEKGYEQLKGKHVLLCEDHPLNQEITRAILEEKGMIVEIAENGLEGVEKFKRSSIDFYTVILMDIRMPLMDGYKATAQIRKLRRADAGTVRILAMTADAFTDDIQRCLSAGMNGHISKPVEPDTLFAEILNKGNGR
jgi:signal transduction histidine kinase/ActR/RegA family two-component response regulator